MVGAGSVQFSAVQCSAVQCSAVQCSAGGRVRGGRRQRVRAAPAKASVPARCSAACLRGRLRGQACVLTWQPLRKPVPEGNNISYIAGLLLTFGAACLHAQHCILM
jgi:hypothetical protein